MLQRPIERAQYRAVRYTARLREAGAVASVGAKGDSYDNAMAEALNSLYKAEVITQTPSWTGLDDVEAATADWVGPTDSWTGMCPSTPRSTAPTSTQRIPRALIRTQGARANHKNDRNGGGEPAGHGVGRSRGGLTTKIHHAVDGKGRPLSVVITGGQRHDGAMLEEVLADIWVPRLGSGRPRTRPDAVLGDKAYSSQSNRDMLREREITAVIPERSDQKTARKKRGSNGGRPPAFDAESYKNRNVVERSFALAKQWRALATRYDKLAITYRAGAVLSAILTWLKS